MSDRKIQKIKLHRISSRSSYLDIFEFSSFKIKRVFTVSNVRKNTTRGYHAHRIDTQIVTVPYGKIKFKTFDGQKTRIFFLKGPNDAIIIKPYVWTETTYLETKTVVVVYSNHKYNEKSYIRSMNEFKKNFKTKSY